MAEIKKGAIFGKLTAVSDQYKTTIGKTTNFFVDMVCQCGNPRTVYKYGLTKGVTTCCADCVDTSTISVAVGERYGKWTVTSKAYRVKNKASQVRKVDVRCSCGTESSVALDRLVHSKTNGCLKCSSINHGMKKTSTYRIWQAMKDRCANENVEGYENYGGRGITVCERWLESFENFYEDMGKRPKNRSIDRENNELGYNKDNCRWATRQTQARNTRANTFIEWKGESKTMAEWSEITGISYTTIRSRNRRGWSAEKIFTTKVEDGVRGKLIEYDGKTLSVPEWAVETGINISTIKARIRKGYALSEVFEPVVNY